jgi:hypothetical protein
MNIIKKALKDIINWAHRDDYSQEPSTIPVPYNGIKSSSASHSRSNINDLNNGMNFTVFGAVGGKVIQIHSYDPRTDRPVATLYIVTDKEDLGEELAQIITKESLSR